MNECRGEMSPERIRLQLLEGGYCPLPLNGKIPVLKGWQKREETTRNEIAFWSHTHSAAENTGILTRFTPALDIDILDPEAAGAVEDLVRDRFGERGCILVRFGKRPKRAILFQTSAPFVKIAVNFAVADGAPGEKLEFLGNGQQVVVDGVHPDTHQPYAWFGGSLLDVKRAELPSITAEEAQATLDDAAWLLVQKLGYRLRPTNPHGNSGKTNSHIWRSKDHDFPCTPTGVERRDDRDGRIYAWVRTPDETEHIVAKDELIPANGGDGVDGEGQATDWILTSDVLINHDKLVAFAMRLLKTGMDPGATVNFLRANIEDLEGVDEERRQRRLKEIPAMVKSAQAKLSLERQPSPGGTPPGGPPSGGQPQPPDSNSESRIALDDFRAYMPMHTYIFMPTGQMWPGASVNARIPSVRVGASDDGKPVMVGASAWLDQNRPVEQTTWAPGEPTLISDRLITGGGWIARRGVTVFNQYRPPTIEVGDASEAGSKEWLDHVHRVYPHDADHVVKWLAYRKQRPQEKINHALVLGGPQGIGKDTLLEPAKRAVGPWNFQEVSPQQLLGRFNGFLKSVILRVSEARDLGEVNRYQFYDHTKAITAAPPDVLLVDEKHLREYNIPNVCGVVITTNHKIDGIFLPADDRRHYIAWSDLTKDEFEADYWAKLWSWYDRGGDRNVAAYLASLDLSDFDPKAPPPKTQAFWDIVDANRAPEDAELADVIDKLAEEAGNTKKGVSGPPLAFTLAAVQAMANALAPTDNDGNPHRDSFAHWLNDRKNRRQIPHRFENCGYTPVRNDAAKDGLWKVDGARQVIYALATRSLHDRVAAARQLISLKGKTVFDLDLFGGWQAPGRRSQ
jgi:hypothetical protein